MTQQQAIKFLWGLAACVWLMPLVFVVVGGQNPQQAATPNQGVERHVVADHTWQEGMFETLMESSWPRYALLLIALVLAGYFKWGRRRGGRTP